MRQKAVRLGASRTPLVPAALPGVYDTPSDSVHANVSPGTAATVGAILGGAAGAAGVYAYARRKRRKSAQKGARTRKRHARARRVRRRRPKTRPVHRRKKRGKKHAHRRHGRNGLHYTKNGQPYRIMANGKARFVKKR